MKRLTLVGLVLAATTGCREEPRGHEVPAASTPASPANDATSAPATKIPMH